MFVRINLSNTHGRYIDSITLNSTSAMTDHTSLNDFYKRNAAPLPEGIEKEIGHFNVFETEKLFDKNTGTRIMPYSRRGYYKISWMRGQSRAEYADKIIDI